MWTANAQTQSIWRSPLVPIAMAFTAGVLADRFLYISFAFSVVATIAFLAAWLAFFKSRQAGLALFYLWCSAAAFGAGYNHWFRENQGLNDIGRLASHEPSPVFLRGVLHSEPYATPQVNDDPLRTQMPRESWRAVLRATQVNQNAAWRPISGLAMLNASGALSDLHVGDEIELVGRIFIPKPPGNPGEHDYAAYLRDQRIHAIIVVKEAPQSVRRIAKRWPRSVRGWLAITRAWANDVLKRYLPEDQRRVASALLLGDTNAMAGAEWEKYLQTGVIHVLAISGQHLVFLAAFLWIVLRVFQVSRRSGAVGVAIFLLGYAMLTGGRPPVMRSAIMMLVLCSGLLLRRPFMLANSFALAWLVVLLINPADVVNGGCILSFLSVAVLSWGIGSFTVNTLIPQSQTAPLQALVDETRPQWLQVLRRLGRDVAFLYFINATVWIAVMPLVAQRYHIVSPVALLIGPVMIFFSAVALLSGFMLLLFGAFLEPLAWLFALICNAALWASNAVVSISANWSWSFWYVPAPPDWWLIVLYAALLIWLTHPVIQFWRWICITAAGIWILVLPISSVFTPSNREFRCTFLAVGHGGCTVIETPDGRTLLYDAGAISGPDVTRRQIAPYLWQRGIRRIDELFLSHADLDHFNGVPALLARFPVGRATMTPTFAQRGTPGAELALSELRRHGVPIHVVHAGGAFAAGDISFEVLHPPPHKIGVKENERSMVVLLSYQERSILLTGDLEAEGMEMFLQTPKVSVDILMAPHHGSESASPVELAKWAAPKLVVSSQSKSIWANKTGAIYRKHGAEFLPTWEHGAITIRIRHHEVHVDSFGSKRQWTLD